MANMATFQNDLAQLILAGKPANGDTVKQLLKVNNPDKEQLAKGNFDASEHETSEEFLEQFVNAILRKPLQDL